MVAMDVPFNKRGYSLGFDGNLVEMLVSNLFICMTVCHLIDLLLCFDAQLIS